MHTAALMESLASIGVRSAWESLLIGGFLTLLLRQMPGLSPKMSFRAWGAGFALSTLLPWCRPGVTLGLHHLVATAVPPETANGHVALASQGLGVAAQEAASLLRLSSTWAEAICVLWALATAFALLRFGAGVWALDSLIRVASPAPPAAQVVYRELVAGDFPRSRRARSARLLVAEGLTAPSACGLFGACILLPAGLVESLSEEELEGVLRHEAAHLRRWDDWLAIAVRLLRAMSPLAVGLPYLDRRMARAREMACDDAALRRGVSRPGYPVCYAACLARLAEKSTAESWQKLAPGLGGDGSQLAARVGHILCGANALRRPGWARLAVSSIAALGMAWGLLASPALLSFSNEVPIPQLASFAGIERAAPRLTAPAVTAILPLPKPRPTRWLTSPVSSQRETNLVTDTMQRVAATQLHCKARFEVADVQSLPRATVARGLNILGTGTREPDSLSIAPQAVFVFWTEAQDWSGGNLVLLFTSPYGHNTKSSAHIVLFNI
jgi:beta-lactamase regulating signal transducer with metallopeptidase domain